MATTKKTPAKKPAAAKAAPAKSPKAKPAASVKPVAAKSVAKAAPKAPAKKPSAKAPVKPAPTKKPAAKPAAKAPAKATPAKKPAAKAPAKKAPVTKPAPAKKPAAKPAAKAPAKATPAKKPAAQAAPAKKPVAKTAPAKKPVAAKPAPAAKAPAKKAPAAQPAPKPAAKAPAVKPAAKPAPAKKPAAKAEAPAAPIKPTTALPTNAPAPGVRLAPVGPRFPVVRPKSASRSGAAKGSTTAVIEGGKTPFSDEELEKAAERLTKERDELTHRLKTLQNEALTHGGEENVEEDGTGAFTQSHYLRVAAEANARIAAINQALQMVKEKKYGVCQMCGCKIARDRLRANPASIRCVSCKKKYEDSLRDGQS